MSVQSLFVELQMNSGIQRIYFYGKNCIPALTIFVLQMYRSYQALKTVGPEFEKSTSKLLRKNREKHNSVPSPSNTEETLGNFQHAASNTHPLRSSTMKLHVRHRNSAGQSYKRVLENLPIATFDKILREKINSIRGHQDFKLQDHLENIAHHARVYADVTRNYAKDNVGFKRLVSAGCLMLILLYFYYQSAKNRALSRHLEKTRVADMENLNNIQRAALRSCEKLQIDMSSRENQIGLLSAQNGEQMNAIDRLTASLKICEFKKKNEVQ